MDSALRGFIENNGYEYNEREKLIENIASLRTRIKKTKEKTVHDRISTVGSWSKDF